MFGTIKSIANQGKLIGGVCAAIARKCGLSNSVWIIRLLFLLSATFIALLPTLGAYVAVAFFINRKTEGQQSTGDDSSNTTN